MPVPGGTPPVVATTRVRPALLGSLAPPQAPLPSVLAAPNAPPTNKTWSDAGPLDTFRGCPNSKTAITHTAGKEGADSLKPSKARPDAGKVLPRPR
jgi:hypothetical protein